MTNYPISTESDIYTFIKKNLSIQSAYPHLQPESYLRVVLLGIYGWNPHVLYALKVFFQQLLPEDLRNELKVAIVSASRPISFFGVSYDADWYFFVQDEEEISLEEEVTELEMEKIRQQVKDDMITGIYATNSVAAIMESVSKITHEANHAAVLYAASVGILSKFEHSNTISLTLNAQIMKIFHKITLLDGGPFTSYDVEKSLFPLIMFTSVEEALKISPSVLIYDPQRSKDTLADLRIHCNLKTDEFTSEFCNLDPARQSNVMRLLKGRIKVYKDQPQLCWLRRMTSVPAIDVIYILMAILAGWDTKDNTSTLGRAPIIASDFLYSILIDRMFQESSYDSTVLMKLKRKTIQYILRIYDLISEAKIRSKSSGSDVIIITTLYPSFVIRQSDHLRFLGYLISSIQAKGANSDNRRCMIFIKNPDSDMLLCYGYSPDVRVDFPDIWSLVFTSISHDNPNFIYDVLNPTSVHIKSTDVNNAKKIILDRLRIALEAKNTYKLDTESEAEEDDV